jgi:predicted Zn-dependent peptidase
MVMSMQTIDQQASMRTDGILNDYPIDYYDKYPIRLAAVTADQVREVMNKYVDSNAFTIVVVAPAKDVKPQLEKLGPVEVRPMPAMRKGAATRQSNELLK